MVVSEDQRVVDGYNRWRVARHLGLDEVECDVCAYSDEGEMERPAIVLNSKRRHLNSNDGREALRDTLLDVSRKLNDLLTRIENTDPVRG